MVLHMMKVIPLPVGRNEHTKRNNIKGQTGGVTLTVEVKGADCAGYAYKDPAIRA